MKLLKEDYDEQDILDRLEDLLDRETGGDVDYTIYGYDASNNTVNFVLVVDPDDYDPDALVANMLSKNRLLNVERYEVLRRPDLKVKSFHGDGEVEFYIPVDILNI